MRKISNYTASVIGGVAALVALTLWWYQAQPEAPSAPPEPIAFATAIPTLPQRSPEGSVDETTPVVLNTETPTQRPVDPIEVDELRAQIRLLTAEQTELKATIDRLRNDLVSLEQRFDRFRETTHLWMIQRDQSRSRRTQ